MALSLKLIGDRKAYLEGDLKGRQNELILKCM